MSEDVIYKNDIRDLIDACKHPVQTRPLSDLALKAGRDYEELSRRLQTLFEVVPTGTTTPVEY